MKSRRTLTLGLCVGAALTAPTLAGDAVGATHVHPRGFDTPYQRGYPVVEDQPNQATLIVRAHRHPEVAVSRSLAAQPVRPWMARVVLNDAISTSVDPLNDLTRNAGPGTGLDENHTLVQAQRLSRRIHGIGARDLAARANRRRSRRNRPAAANRAMLIRPDRSSPEPDAPPQPAAPRNAPAADPLPGPAPKATPRPIPSVPRMRARTAPMVVYAR